jgi:hypothetical protein
MTSPRFSQLLAPSIFMVAIWTLSQPAFGQGPLLDAPAPAAESVSPVALAPASVVEAHKFWDTKNCVLFAASTALNWTDFAVTRANLQSGGRELNPLVRPFGRSTPGLAVNFAGETAGVIGLSYFFHKTSHHKLERIVSMVNIGGSVGAVSYGLAHR